MAVAAAATGARVELAGRVGDDPEGDALLFGLTGAGVGHAAMLRDATFRTPVIAPAVDVDGDDDVWRDTAAAPAQIAGGPRLDAADVTLALRYLDPAGVLVVTDDVAPDAVVAAVDGSVFAGMRLVLLVADAAAAPDGLPGDATILVAPEAAGVGETGAFEALVGAFAAALDAGAPAREAFAAAASGAAWEPVAGEA